MPDLDDLRGDPNRVHEAAIELEGLRRHHLHGDEDCWRSRCHGVVAGRVPAIAPPRPDLVAPRG